MPPLDSLELALFLVGDAGSNAYDGEPVLLELSKQSDSLRPVRQFVVFLGDNVYPRGVPPAGHPNRDDAERKIAAQVLAIRKGSAQGILVPGNHDWDRSGRDGWNSIRRQDTLVQKFGGEDVRLLPGGGCPGPEVIDLGEQRADHRAGQRVVAAQRREAVRTRVPLRDAGLPGGHRFAEGRAPRQGRAACGGGDPPSGALRGRARRRLQSGGPHLPPPQHGVLALDPAALHRLTLSVRPDDGHLEPGHQR